MYISFRDRIKSYVIKQSLSRIGPDERVFKLDQKCKIRDPTFAMVWKLNPLIDR